MEALREGLPMVVLPITNDQPGVAMRIEYLGAGERIMLKRLTANTLRNAVVRVMNDPCYRQRAAKLAQEMRSVNGPDMAAELIERAFAPDTEEAVG